MTAGDPEQPVDRLVADSAPGTVELRLHELAEERERDRPDLHRLRAPVERLVLVAEEPPPHVALAPRVDVRDTGLLLEDGAHLRGELRVDLRDLLELVEGDDDPAALVGGDLRG